MVANGLRKPHEQAGELNAMNLMPFGATWTARLVVMFFKRQDERRKATAAAQKAIRDNGIKVVTDSIRAAVRRTDRPPANPVFPKNLPRLSFWLGIVAFLPIGRKRQIGLPWRERQACSGSNYIN